MNLEPRYVSQNGKEFEAWIFGAIDALEFFQNTLKHYQGVYTPREFEMTAGLLAEDIAEFASKHWREEFDHANGTSTVPVSTGSCSCNSSEEEGTASRPARTGQDLRSPSIYGADGSLQSRRQQRNSNPESFSQRKDSMDQDDRAILATEVSLDDCGGSGHWFCDQEGHLIGVCSCLARYPSPNSSSKSRHPSARKR
mgnify:CR=1 FL=1